MDPEKKPEDEKAQDEAASSSGASTEEPQAPADALSRTPEELNEEQAKQVMEGIDPNAPKVEEKKLSPFKKIFRKVNLYFLIFLLLIVVAAAISIVNYLNSQKAEPAPSIASQELTQDALKQLANTDTSVGDASQTLTIQGNAIIAGQTLMRGNLNIAGNLQTGGTIQGPTLTISGSSNLGETQANNLQVATNAAVQGTTTLRDLNVSGASGFSGPIVASQITVTRLILAGNAVLQIPNHISFTGPAPTRTINSSVLGSGGTVSLSGSDTSGTISINTGGSTTPGCLVRINFQQAFISQPRVIISPVGVGAGQMQFYSDRNTTGFSICSANAAPANQVFSFDYFVAY